MKKFMLLELVCIVCFASAAFALRADDTLNIYWVDTEGGAATLIVTPSGETVLIDSGNPGGRDSGRIIDCARKAANISKIDFLVTTHYHIDHFGGAAEVAGQLPIKTVYDNGVFEGGGERPSKTYSLFPAEKRVVLNPGDELPLTNSPGKTPVKIKCLCARQQTIEAPKDAPDCALCGNPKRLEKDQSDNANSIVLLLSFGDFRFYAGGDLTWNVEEKLVCPKELVGQVDVYQVTHHGLDISNNPLVLQSLKPKVAIMSNGISKGSGTTTWHTLRDTKSLEAVFQIHKNLTSEKNNTSDDLIANLSEKCDGNFIKLQADAQAKSYTVSIPATKVSKPFSMQTR